MPKNARNPKVVRFTLRLDDTLNTRLEQLADAAGQNKGVMASVTLAAGLSVLENVYLPPNRDQVIRDVHERLQQIYADTAVEIENARDVED